MPLTAAQRKKIPMLPGVGMQAISPRSNAGQRMMAKPATQRRQPALQATQASMTPVNAGNNQWDKVPGSRLDYRQSTIPVMRAGAKGSNQTSSPVGGWSTEQASRFNRPTGPYLKVNRPRIITQVGGQDQSSGYNQSSRLVKNSMPDFSRGNSRANRAVQRSNEAKWMLDRGRGVDAQNLAITSGGQRLADTAMSQSGATGRTAMTVDAQENIAAGRNQADFGERMARSATASALEKGRNTRANAALSSKERRAKAKQYADYRNSFLTNPNLLQEDLLSEDEYFSGGKKKDSLESEIQSLLY